MIENHGFFGCFDGECRKKDLGFDSFGMFFVVLMAFFYDLERW